MKLQTVCACYPSVSRFWDFTERSRGCSAPCLPHTIAMKIAIAGLGLIGGSFAKAIKQYTSHTVTGYDCSSQALAQAKDCGAIDDIAEDDFSCADLILVSLYPADTVTFIRQHYHTFRKGATVVDLCGVKRFVCSGVRDLFQDGRVTFIGGHPMAGRECSGFENSVPTLFQNASMILTPFSSTPNAMVNSAMEFFRSVGFGKITITTEYDHDEMIAYTSQLAHIVSSAYVKSPVALKHNGYSAGSFQDLTRVAKLNETMWTELFLHNRDFLVGQIALIEHNLQTFRSAIEAGDGETLFRILKEGREIKEQLE